MSFLLKDRFHRLITESVYNELLSQTANYYYAIGKTIEWSSPSTPDTPTSNDQYEYDTRNNIISVKKLLITDVSYVTRRINWVINTVFDQYDGEYSNNFKSSTGASSLKDSNFYVLTSNYQVYKCIYNNKGAKSTIMPTGTGLTPVLYNDGYIWKYLYTIPLSLRNRFLTTTHMPVQKSVTNQFYSNGEISTVIIDNAGSGYLNNTYTTLNVYGTFKSGAGNVVANLRPVINSTGQVIDVRIDNPGNNYSAANIVIRDTLKTGTGYYNTLSTANFIPILYKGAIDRVLINDPGIKYSANNQTTITYFGDGTGAVLTPFINANGELEEVIIEKRGSGYTYIDISVVGAGSNANAYAVLSTGDLTTTQSHVELSAIDGALYSFRVLKGGDNYTTANITVTGDGVNFIGNVVIDSNTNSISKITVVNPGSGYSYANVVIDGNGANANIQAIISPINGHGYNPVSELFADSLMFYSTINNEKNQGVTVNNDYRQISIIKNLKKFDSKLTYSNILGSACYLITLDDVTDILADDTLTVLDNNLQIRKFSVIEVVGSTSQVLVSNKNNYALSVENIFTNTRTGSSYTIGSIDQLPDINKFSGDLLFIDNRTSVSYSDQQLVTLRTVIQL